MAADDTDLVRTRRSLHGVAELVLAGPQYRTSNTIRLRPYPGGFGTVAAPQLRVDGVELVHRGVRVALAGRTYAELAAEVAVPVGAPADLYHDGSGADPDDLVDVTPAAARVLADCFARGDEALRAFATAHGATGATPVLWPEHFDLSVTLDEVNYGVSPGDGYLPEPYAYVGPWQPRQGVFWNAPFGAARPVAELSDVDAMAMFFAQGRDLAAG